MDIKLINSVILSENYEKLVEWYVKTLDLEIKLQVDKDYHYTDLAKNGKLTIGVCPASEMDHVPSHPRNNSTIIQISVSDIRELFGRVKEAGGTILFGPSVDKNEGFSYGAFLDPEGNQVWVMENFDFS